MLLVKQLVSGHESGGVIFCFQTVAVAICLSGTPYPAIWVMEPN